MQYRGRSIRQVLDLTVREALTFFSSSPKVLRRLQVLDEIGLGYLRLGQPATTLSGGEAQRIKIAAHLSSHSGERLLYVLDEPTTGLHFDDIAKLLTAFRKLLEAGHSLVVIEHNLDVIKTADYIIDLGPEGGEDGGFVVATGTPEQVAQVEASHTGPVPAAGAGGRTFACLRVGPVGRTVEWAGWARGRGRPGLRLLSGRVGRLPGSCLRSAPPACRVPAAERLFRAGDARSGEPRCRRPAARRADAQGAGVSGGGGAAGEAASSIRQDEVQLEAIAAELNIFLAEQIVPRRRVGFIVEVRTPVAAERCSTTGPLAIGHAAGADGGAGRAAHGRARRQSPRRLEAMYAFGALAVEAGRPPRGASCCATSGPDLRRDDRRRRSVPAVRGASASSAASSSGARRTIRVDETVGDAVISGAERRGRGDAGAAMQALGAMRYERGVQALMELFQYYGKGDLAEAALDALARIAHPSSAAAVRRAAGVEGRGAARASRSKGSRAPAIAPGWPTSRRRSDAERNEACCWPAVFASAHAGGRAARSDRRRARQVRGCAIRRGGTSIELAPGRAAGVRPPSPGSRIPRCGSDARRTSLGFSDDPAALPLVEPLAPTRTQAQRARGRALAQRGIATRLRAAA